MSPSASSQDCRGTTGNTALMTASWHRMSTWSLSIKIENRHSPKFLPRTRWYCRRGTSSDHFMRARSHLKAQLESAPNSVARAQKQDWILNTRIRYPGMRSWRKYSERKSRRERPKWNNHLWNNHWWKLGMPKPAIHNLFSSFHKWRWNLNYLWISLWTNQAPVWGKEKPPQARKTTKQKH